MRWLFLSLMVVGGSLQAFNCCDRVNYDTVKGVVDIFNWPLDRLLHLKKAPGLKEIFNKKNECARFSKLAVTAMLTCWISTRPVVKEQTLKVKEQTEKIISKVHRRLSESTKGQKKSPALSA